MASSRSTVRIFANQRQLPRRNTTDMAVTIFGTSLTGPGYLNSADRVKLFGKLGVFGDSLTGILFRSANLLVPVAGNLTSGSSIAQAPPGKWAPLAVAPNHHVSVADQFSLIGVIECPIETVMEQLNSLGTNYAMGNGVGRNPKKALLLFAL
jgi:hypothetical protein